MDFTLRPSQIEVLRYRSGKMGIAAVPGSGKTFTLSALAAQIIRSGALASDQEVLIVTLVHSAVDNFAARIGRMVEKHGLLPHLGYRVRTLHGLAHDIVREKPALAGLEERFSIVDEREAELIRKDAVKAWLANHEDEIGAYLKPDGQDFNRQKGRRGLQEALESLCTAFIRSAKDERLTPDALRARLDASPPLPLAEMGWAVYADYQRALAYRGAVDFDDLIRLAYRVLESDPEYLARLRYRFPYVLEDEAQDSSQIQEAILRLLAGEGNWVRVGDPNQAIFETFTTANPRLLRDFIAHEADWKRELPVSGRSQPAIIDLANRLIEWTRNEHPAEACRSALGLPYIHPAEADDPQPNPPADPAAVQFASRKYKPEEEAEAIARSLENWLPTHADWTVAILVPRNGRGAEMVEALKRHKVDYVELMSSSNSTRMTAGAIANVFTYLSDPGSAAKLAKAYQVWRRAWREEESLQGFSDSVASVLRRIRRVEAYLFPEEEMPFVLPPGLSGEEEENLRAELNAFAEVIRRWQASVLLPIDQMTLTLAQDLFTEPAELALAHKLALALRQAAEAHSYWRLPELAAELSVIARNERRFLGFSSDDSGFDPERHRGRVVVATMHKAKGLEWDRVYLTSMNNYDFPSLQAEDNYIGEKWFVRDSLNLEAEALAQLRAAVRGTEFDWYEEGKATLTAREEYVRERLRLLFVGITRARRDLVFTWNTGRQGGAKPCLPLEALKPA